MMSLEFPYTSYNFVQPAARCAAMMETVDPRSVVTKVRSCGTDVVCWQDRYSGQIIPYTSVWLAKEEEAEKENPSETGRFPAFLTVFTTPFVRSAFHCMAEQLDLEIVERLRIDILSANGKFVTQSTILDTLTLLDRSGAFPVDVLAGMLSDLKAEDEILYTKEQYWGSVFGYALSPVTARTKFDSVVRRHVARFQYAVFD